jgi:histone arginine demethylase JMJD6
MNDQIEHRANLSYAEFSQDYLFPHRPVVITDALREWKAVSRWTPEFFKKEFSDMKFSLGGKRGNEDFTMSTFIDRVMASDETSPAPYFRNQVLDEVFPSLKQDVQPLPPYFFPNWMGEPFFVPGVRRSLNRGGAMEIYIGGKGASFPYLHYDGMATHAFLLQIYGQKRFILYGPEQEQYLYPNPERPNQTLVLDLDRPDLEKFPLFAKAKPISFVLEPGEMLFIPHRWWHTTKMLGPSISVSVNVLNQSNWASLTDWVAKRKPLLELPTRAYLDCAGAWQTAKDRRRGTRPASVKTSSPANVLMKPGFGFKGLEKIAVNGMASCFGVMQSILPFLE